MRKHSSVLKRSFTGFIVTFVFVTCDPLTSSAQWWTKPKDIADHFYTTSATERDNAVKQFGYQSEGTCCFVSSTTKPGPGTVPLYRLFNPDVGDHFYTTSSPERQNAVAHLGYKDEGLCCYVLQQPTSAVPLYRLFNPDSGDHFYTTSYPERTKAINEAGYRPEGICCYVSTSPTAAEDTPLFRLYLLKSTKSTSGSSLNPPATSTEACLYTATVTNETCYNVDGTVSTILTPQSLTAQGCGGTSSKALARAMLSMETQTCLTKTPNPQAGCCTYSSQVAPGCACK